MNVDALKVAALSMCTSHGHPGELLQDIFKRVCIRFVSRSLGSTTRRSLDAGAHVQWLRTEPFLGMPAANGWC